MAMQRVKRDRKVEENVEGGEDKAKENKLLRGATEGEAVEGLW